MKAAQIVGPQRFEIVDVAKPDVSSAKDGSVLVKVDKAAICGTDVPEFAYEHPASEYPRPPGASIHECVGVIAQSRSKEFKEGDEVLSLPAGPGGLMEYFPSDEDCTVHLPRYEKKEHIVLSQPLGTIIWAFRKLENIIHWNVVVVGQGPIGLLMDSLLSNLGAKRIIGLDLLDYRLDVAMQMRATHTVNVIREDAIQKVRDITDGKMADLVIEAVGHQTGTINTCLDLVKHEGTVFCFGVPDEPVYDFRYEDILRKNLSMVGSGGPEVKRDFPLAIDMIVQGRTDVSPIVTHVIPFDEVQRGFEIFTKRTDGAIKVVLDYNSI